MFEVGFLNGKVAYVGKKELQSFIQENRAEVWYYRAYAN